MKKFLLSIFALSVMAISTNAQDAAKKVATDSQSASASIIATAQADDDAEKKSNWKVSGILTFNASATGLVNWAAGGNNNINMK